MKKSIISIFSLAMLLTLAACNQQSSSITSNTSEHTTNLITETNITSSSSSTNNQDSDHINSENGMDVDFGSLKVTGSLKDLPPDPDDENKDLVSKARVNLINVINQDLPEPILDSIVADGKVQIQEFEVENKEHYNYLIIGSKNIGNDGSESFLGSLTFEFTRNIKEISFKVKGYHKFAFDAYPDSERKMNYDKDVKVDVLAGDSETPKTTTLPNNETFAVPQTIINVKLSNPTNVFTIKNHDNKAYNRFFLEGLSLVYDK